MADFFPVGKHSMDFGNMLLWNSKKLFVGIANQNYDQHSKEILITMRRMGNCCPSGDDQWAASDIMRNT